MEMLPHTIPTLASCKCCELWCFVQSNCALHRKQAFHILPSKRTRSNDTGHSSNAQRDDEPYRKPIARWLEGEDVVTGSKGSAQNRRAKPRAVLHGDEVADRVEGEDQLSCRDRHSAALGLPGLLDPADLEPVFGELDVGESQATRARWQSDEFVVDSDQHGGEPLEVDACVGSHRFEVERVDTFDLVQPRHRVPLGVVGRDKLELVDRVLAPGAGQHREVPVPVIIVTVVIGVVVVVVAVVAVVVVAGPGREHAQDSEHDHDREHPRGPATRRHG